MTPIADMCSRLWRTLFVDADNSNPIGDVLGSDITYATETSKEGKYVLRVRVKPYTFGLVKFKDGSRPEGLHDHTCVRAEKRCR